MHCAPQAELAHIQTLVTLSPLPAFRDWLEAQLQRHIDFRVSLVPAWQLFDGLKLPRPIRPWIMPGAVHCAIIQCFLQITHLCLFGLGCFSSVKFVCSLHDGRIGMTCWSATKQATSNSSQSMQGNVYNLAEVNRASVQWSFMPDVMTVDFWETIVHSHCPVSALQESKHDLSPLLLVAEREAISSSSLRPHDTSHPALEEPVPESELAWALADDRWCRQDMQVSIAQSFCQPAFSLLLLRNVTLILTNHTTIAHLQPVAERCLFITVQRYQFGLDCHLWGCAANAAQF